MERGAFESDSFASLEEKLNWVAVYIEKKNWEGSDCCGNDADKKTYENVIGLDRNFVLIRRNGSSLKAGGL